MKDRALFNDSGKEKLYKELRVQVQGQILLDTEGNWKWPRSVAVDADRLSAVCKVG